MKKWVHFVLFISIFVLAACGNSNKSNKKNRGLAQVINTDTMIMACGDNGDSVKLVFLGDQGKYERVTVFMGSNQKELIADTADSGQRFTATDKSMSMLSKQGVYTFYNDTNIMFSCSPNRMAREFKTATGVTYVIEETHPNGASLSNLRITSRGLKETEADWSYTDIDPVKDVLMGDINNDGFDELFIITEVAGSGGYNGIIGLASNNDKSSSAITVPELTEEDMKPSQLFEGYQGHDKIYIEKKKLVREFPVYRSGDANSSPSGGNRKVNYTLSKGEASWVLTAVPAQ